MRSTQPNIIPINEFINNFDHFIYPIHPGEFDITPILRARYGNLLRDDIVSIRLFAEHRNVVLLVTSIDNTVRGHIDFANTRIDKTSGSIMLNELFFNDLPIAPDRDAPYDERRAWFNRILWNLLWFFDASEIARHLHVFTPHYLALLERIQINNNYESELVYTEKRLESSTIFYEDSILNLAKPVQVKALENLLELLANRMKKQEATEILNGGLITYWDEVGVIACESNDNMLLEILYKQIEADVYDAIIKLSEAEQFALWFFGEEVDANLANWFSDGDYEKDISSIKKDFTLIIQYIRDELLGMAMDSLSPEANKYLGYF